MEKNQTVSDNNKFIKARTEYHDLRRGQRQLIIDEIEKRIDKKEWKISMSKIIKGRGAGQGNSKYTSGGSLVVPFDLSYWLWLDLRNYDKEKEGTIFFQSHDIDPNTGNTHVMLDRVSFGYKGSCIKRIQRTNYDLPLDAKTRSALIDDFCKFLQKCEKDDGLQER